MNKLFFTIFLSIPLLGDGFLTPIEHGERIYKETRGVSCASCHGENKEGKMLATVENKNKKTTLLAPALKNLDLKALKKGIKNHKIAPPYYLSTEELEVLLVYINQ